MDAWDCCLPLSSFALSLGPAGDCARGAMQGPGSLGGGQRPKQCRLAARSAVSKLVGSSIGRARLLPARRSQARTIGILWAVLLGLRVPVQKQLDPRPCMPIQPGGACAGPLGPRAKRRQGPTAAGQRPSAPSCVRMRRWLSNTTEPDFDLAVVYIGRRPRTFVCPECTHIWRMRGLKWQIIQRVSSGPKWDELAAQYDYVMFADDDLIMTACGINTHFRVMKEVRGAVHSFHAGYILLRNLFGWLSLQYVGGLLQVQLIFPASNGALGRQCSLGASCFGSKGLGACSTARAA